MFQSSDTMTHWILGGGTITSIIAGGISFGMLKADNTNTRERQKDHDAMDNDRFHKLDERLGELFAMAGQTHEIVVGLAKVEELRSQGMLKTRHGDAA